MTSWSKIKSIGSGIVDYRLMIEGWPDQWVTHPRITASSGANGRKVYPGLQYDGLRIQEQLDLREAWPRVSGMTITIKPTGGSEETVSGFTRDARPYGTLVNTLATTDTTWLTFPDPLGPNIYHVGSEAIYCDGASNIVRGYWDTEAQVHPTTEGVFINPVPIYNYPPTMEGRRALLYVYGPSDDPTGDGNVIWRGVVSRPPRMASDGVSWTIEIDPITTLFDQNVGGGDRTEYKVRGIYHSAWCPMAIAAGTEGVGGVAIGMRYITGFFESQADWVSWVNDVLADMIADGPDTDVTGLTYGVNDGGYFIEVHYAASVMVTVLVKDVLDGDMPITAPGNARAFNSVDNAISAGDSSGSFVVQATSRQPPWGYPLPAARCMVGAPNFDAKGTFGWFGYKGYTDLTALLYPGTPGDVTWPPNRIYLETVVGLEVGMVLCARNDEDGRFMRIDLINTEERYIEVTVPITDNFPVYIGSDTALIPVADYGSISDIARFLIALAAQAPNANLGRTPYISDRDADVVGVFYNTWVTNPMSVYWGMRNYQFLKATKVRDIMVPELMATGFVARLESDGRLGVARMPSAAPNRTADHTLTDDEICYPAQNMFGFFPRWEAQRDGLVNIVTLQLGYNPITDEYDPRYDYTIRNTASVAAHKSGDRAQVTISPKSASVGTVNGAPAVPIMSEIVEMVAPYLNAMSRDYAIVTVAVPFTMFDVKCGDIVDLTSAVIPNELGLRGVVNKKTICVGREFDLDPASNTMGTLTLWLPRDGGASAGYSPTGRVTAQSNSGGNIWVLTFSTADAFNIAWSEDGNGDVVRHFAVNDTVKVVQVDVTSPTIVRGVVTTKPASNQLTVSFEASWTPGASTWNLRFWHSNVTARQLLYCWVADSGGRLPDGSAARVFS